MVISFKIPSFDKIFPFNEIYSKIYTISYYSGVYSSLKDQNWAKSGHIVFWSWFQCEYLTFILKTIIKLNTLAKFKMTAIRSTFISQRAVKAWIVANCIEFPIIIFVWAIFKVFYTQPLRQTQYWICALYL